MKNSDVIRIRTYPDGHGTLNNLFHPFLAFLAAFFENLRLSGTSRIDQRVFLAIKK
jgi:hypothetical protein